MATSTPNLNLTLPSSGDRIDVEVLNRNFEKLDDRLGGVSDSIIVDDLDSANLVHVADATARSAVGLKTYVEVYQIGNGDPSPDISGWDAFSVIRTGRNLYPGGDLAVTGSKSVYFPVPLPPGTYTVSADVTSDATGTVSRITFVGGREDGSNLAVDLARGTQTSAKIIVSNPVERLVLYSGTNNSNSSGVAATWSNVQIIFGSVKEDYEPYQEQILTAELPETVYGGSLDWATGVLTSTLDAGGNALEEPKTFQLTPQQLNLLKGVNNVWSTCGETKVVYIADTKRYIDEKFAALAAAQLGV